MTVKTLYKKVAKELGTTEDRVQMIYSAYWNCIKDGLKNLDIHDGMTKSDFEGNKYGYFIYKVGRLYCDYKVYKVKNERLQKLKDKKHAENNEDKANV